MRLYTYAVIAGAALVLSVGFRLTHPPRQPCAGGIDLALATGRPVVVFGDSISWGWGIRSNCLRYADVGNVEPDLHVQGARDQTYPAFLGRMTKRLVLNYGWPGETASDGLGRLAGVVRTTHPSTVLLLEGLNDLLHGHRSPAQVAHTLQLMIWAAHTRVVISTLLPVYGRYAWARPAIAATNVRIRHLRAAQVVDLARIFAGRRTLIQSDGVHPTPAGARVIARQFGQALRSGSALSGS